MNLSDIRSRVLAAPAQAGNPAAPAPASTPAEPVDQALIGTAASEAAPPRLDKAAPGKPEYVPGQVIVKFAPHTSAADVAVLAKSQGLSTLRHFQVPQQMLKGFGGELYQFALSGNETVEEAVARLSGRPGVLYAEPNYKLTLNDPKPSAGPSTNQAPTQTGPGLPNDLDERLWGIRNHGQDNGTTGKDVGAADAWAVTTGSPNGQGPKIVVIDTGIDYNHPDLRANVWNNPNETPGNAEDDDHNGVADDVHGANLNKKDGDPMDDNGHGSHCAGTIGAVGNNGGGIVGVNWNATIAGAKFLDANGSGSYADAVDAVLYATKIGARITSNSWGGGGFSQALYDAFKASPALHIAAAGNDGTNTDTTPSYPGAFNLDNIVSVAAIDRRGHLADFSNYGATTVDVAAPGVDIFSLKPGGGYTTMSGTSMATPHVSGVAGLILSEYPDLTNEQVKTRLISTAVKEDELTGKCVAGGLVNAANALENDFTPPATPSDLKVTGSGATSMSVGWSSVGDDDMTGNASLYQVRYSDKPITVDGADGTTSWDTANVGGTYRGVSSVSQPLGGKIVITPDETSKHLYFAIKAFDNLGNVSGMGFAEGDTVAAAVPFKDDFEAGTASWSAGGKWGLVDVPGHGKVYTDSPSGSYPSNANSAITSRAIDLSQVANPRLSFSTRYDTEASYDVAHVEVSTDGGKKWSELAHYTGTSDWVDQTVDLSAYAGKSVQVRFRLTSDGSMEKDGFYVDNVQLAGDPA